MNAHYVLPVLLLCARVAFCASTYYADPAAGSQQGNGSAGSPWRTLAEVVGARKLRPGDTLFLCTGYHGDVTIRGDNEEFITIAAAPGHEPRVSKLVVSQGRRWKIKGLTISPSFAEKPYGGNMVVLAEGGVSSEIVLEDCFVYSKLDSSSWTAKEWMETNSGIFSGRHGTNITLRNNYVLNTRFGIALCSPESVCEGNVVKNFSGDGLRVTRDDITVQYNIVRNIYVGDGDGDDNHDDGIQCFLFNKGTGTVRRVTIRGNILVQRDEGEMPPLGTNMQGIGFFDGPLIDFLVEKNVVMVAHWHGVSLYDARGCTIQDNACFSRWKGRAKPWVMIGSKARSGGARGNKVLNNMAHAFKLRDDKEVVEDNNVSVNEQRFYVRMNELAALIDKKFGRFHPVAKVARLTDQKGDPGQEALSKKDAAASKGPIVYTKERKKAHPDAIMMFDSMLVDRLRASLEGGTKVKFYMQSVQADAVLNRIDDDATLRTTVTRPRMEMSIKFERLSLAERKSLALCCVSDGDEAGHALVAFYALATNDDDRAREHLRYSGDMAADIEGMFTVE